jgi:hypothetical protein
VPLPRVTNPADPNRCQGSAPDGQCQNLAVPGYDFCQVHGGKVEKAKAQDLRLYRLDKVKYRDRLEELNNYAEIKSLRNEISLTRMLIEERLNAIKNEADLLSAYSTVNTLLLTTERLIKTAHQVEQSLGTLLSKATVVNISQNIVQILSEELAHIDHHEDIVDKTCERMLQIIAEASNTPNP